VPTHEQAERAIALLRALMGESPATEPDEYDIGRCLYCGARVRNIRSKIIHHREDCHWWIAKQFVDNLPDDWGE
jgi:hypothetical protein